MIAVQIFGLRIYTLAATKLVATAGGRKALNQIRDQIREGKMVYIGNCSAPQCSSFQLITNTLPQQGNALIIYPTTNGNYYSIYYLDTSTGTNRLVQFNATYIGASVEHHLHQHAGQVYNQQHRFRCQELSEHIVSNYAVLDNRDAHRGDDAIFAMGISHRLGRRGGSQRL